ncbi:MAG: glycogen synthase GlgA [Syntrophaceticus sp.]|jgi:starch synthase|nr:glycogen synthase GlgA [Syntrophaceticus sp.]MDD4359033.1 glycogen synthase GlgA [Syntrophaceticus sp.]MDD4782651.1 glycogen synthase GlgA [Syntrophaceticus sp.]HBG22122.1 glycogen synthase GlgA [Peptococcaceae bacterium]
MAAGSLKILFASAEVSPFAKTGGLADVAGSLPKALKRLGHDVRIAMPKYKWIDEDEYLLDYPVEMDHHLETGIVKKTKLKGNNVEIPVYLMESYKYYYRDNLYGYDDEAERFNFFSKAVLNMLPQLDFQPDIIHCNDWQTGMIPLSLKTKYAEDPFYNKIATLFTIHNLQYQGVFPKDTLCLVGLSDQYFKPELLEFYGQINFMKAGLLFADLLNTVSKKYALEIQTSEYGQELDGLLRKRAQDLYGIVNGIDNDVFDPEADECIYHNYSLATINEKKENKKALQQEMGLPVNDTPLLGLTTRLVDQKGLDLVTEIYEEIMDLGVQFVLLGSGEDHYQKTFAELKMKYPQQTAANIGFNAELAQKIYAGSDIFLMPSRFEPCGLSQMISLRYGTIPLVRSVGGLADTIEDYNEQKDTGNGFAFKEYDAQELLNTITRAVGIYSNNQQVWQSLMERAMKYDFSWERSAKEYVDLYQKALGKKSRSNNQRAAI